MTIIIPAYRPDEKLLGLIDALKERCEDRILVVDDGSGESYQKLFETVEKKGCLLLRHEVNRGKGAAMKTAFQFLLEEDKEEIFCTADADGQHLPEDILRVLATAKEHPGAMVLGGRRFTGKVPFRSRFGNAMSRFSFRLMLGKRVHDTQSGLRAFTKDLLPRLLKVRGDRYEYEMQQLCTFARKNIPIVEIPIETVYLNENASSHFHPARDALRVYSILLRNACGRVFQILSFIFSSLFACLVDLVIYYIAFNFLFGPALKGDPHLLARLSLLVARIASSLANYFFNRKIVFHNHDNKWKTMSLYGILVVTIFFGNDYLNRYFLTSLHMDEMLSVVLAQLLCFPISFVIQKFLIFPDHKKKK